MKNNLYILPVSKDKRPLIKGGYASASNDPVQIAQWKKQFPGCTWGIRTGIVNKLVVLDFDPRNGSAETIIKLKREGKHLSPDAPMVYTPQKGQHLYYAYPAEGTDIIINSHTNILPGFDILGEGKFVMAPGAESTYGFYSKVDLDVTKLPELPQWVLDLIKGDSDVLHPSQPILAEGNTKGELSTATCLFVVKGAPVGQWNAMLFKAAKDCFEQGYTLEETLSKLEPATRSRDEYLGVFDKTDLRTIESAFSKAPKYEPRGLRSEGAFASERSDEQMEPGKATFAYARDPEGVRASQTGLHVVPKLELITGRTLFPSVKDFLSNKDLIKGLETGIEPLDKTLGGGFRKGELYLFHAETKNGKSTLIHKIIHSLLQGGHQVGYASREMDPLKEVMPSFLSLQEQFDAWTEELKSTVDSIPWIDKIHFAPGYGYLPLPELTEWFKQEVASGTEMIFYDHLHFGLANPEEHKDAAIYIRQLKMLCREYDIPVAVIVQANKMMDGMRLGKNSVKGGAAISQTCDALFTIEKLKDDPYTGAKNMMKVELVEKRHKLAKLGSFYLQYDERTTDLRVMDRVPEPVNDDPPTCGIRTWPPQKFGQGRKY